MPFPILPGQVQPFSRVLVSYLTAGGATISWELQRHFIDPAPYTFQLQVGHTFNPEAADWTDVGAAVIDTFFTVDPDKQQFGKWSEVHYRVKLTTGVDTYFSEAEPASGLLSRRDWLLAREITRLEKLRHRIQTSVDGFLLKAIRYGPACTDCLDPLTQEVTNSHCSTCFGTAFENGYFKPLESQFFDLSTENTREHLNPNTGTEKQDVVQARFVGAPQIESYDAWVDATSDKRYYIHRVSVVAKVRNVPIVVDVELRQAPFSDVIYEVPLSPSVPPEPRHP